jgi:carbonic anhydrase
MMSSRARVLAGVGALIMGLCVLALASHSTSRPTEELSIVGGPADTEAAKAAFAAAHPALPDCPWSYDDQDKWGTICGKRYSLCATGAQQSPINIKLLRLTQGPVLKDIQKTSASRESVMVLPFGDDRTCCDQVIVCVEVIARLTQL